MAVILDGHGLLHQTARVWEHDSPTRSRDYLAQNPLYGCGYGNCDIFSVGFHNEKSQRERYLFYVLTTLWCPKALKTEESDKVVSKNYVGEHLRIGIDSLRNLSIWYHRQAT